MSCREEQWYSAKELAGLRGMPGTAQGINARAKRDNWQARPRAGKGGGREYAFSSLPVETQATLLKSQAPTEPAKAIRRQAPTGPVDRESLWDAFERKPQSQKDEAARRLQVLQGVERLVDNGSGRSRAVEATAKAFGESRSTVYRWLKEVKGLERSDWLAALAPGYSGRSASAECSPEAWEFFKSQYLRPEAPSIATCYAWPQQAAAEHGWVLPSQRTLTRWANAIPKAVRVLKREGEYAMMRLYPAQQRTVRDLHALYWINGDGYQHNVFVRFPDGTVARPKTWFWQDIYSRRIVGYRPDRTAPSDMIRLAIGDVIERYGIPEHVTIDNTRAAANKWLTAGVRTRYRFKVREEDPVGLLPQLGIEVHWTTVHNGKGHGQAKPIERAFGVGGLGEYVDKHPRFAGAYTGPNVTAKPDNYGETAVPWEVFAQVLTDSIHAWNAKEGRRSEICGGVLSYGQAFRQSFEANAHRIRRATEAQRRMWLMAAEAVLVQKDAAVKLNVGGGPNGHNRYSCDRLVDYIGRRVVVRFDPDRLHESVHLYQLDGRYIGEAECIHAAGFGDTSAGREWRRLRKQRLQAGKDAAEAEVRMGAVEAANYLPAAEPEEDSVPQTKVTRAVFGERKRVMGSDVVPDQDDETSTEYLSRFEEAMQRARPHWLAGQLGGVDPEE